MPRGNELLGLPVYGGPRLRQLGRVQEVLLSPDGGRISGLALEKGGWLEPRRVLDYEAVTAVTETHILAAEVYLPEQSRTRSQRDLQGMPVLAPDGEEAGLLDDVHFDAATGRVTALQVSRGLVDDLILGKAVLPLAAPPVTGEAAIFLFSPENLAGGITEP